MTSTSTPKATALKKSDFNTFITVQTRWADNDIYGHVNNATYYNYFDTAVNSWLIDQGLLSLHSQDIAEPIGLVVSNQCQFLASIYFPQTLSIGLRVEHLGNSAVRYGLAVFTPNDITPNDNVCAALAQFTHVYVNRVTRQPMALSEHWRKCLRTILMNNS